MTVDEILRATGDQSKDLIKKEVRTRIAEAIASGQDVAAETAESVKKWLVQWKEGQIDRVFFDHMLATRRRTVQQWVNTQDIASRARLERLTVGLIDIVKDNLLAAIA